MAFLGNLDYAALGISPQVAQQLAANVPSPTPMPEAAATPAPAAATPQVDVSAYLAANPDLAANWNSGGVMRQLGGTLEEAAAAQYARTGAQEIAAGQRTPVAMLAATPSAAREAPATPASAYAVNPTTAPGTAASGLAANPQANWADLYTNAPDAQEWIKNAMQAEFAPAGWAGGKIDSLEEGANYYQQYYGDSGTGIKFAAKNPASFAYDPAKGNSAALMNPTGVVDAYQVANPNIKPFTVNAGGTAAAAVPAPPSGTAKNGSPTYTAPDGTRYAAPELMPAGGQYATPYYAAYTNDNDFAGAVMAQPGQKLRLVDAKTGDVVFEGEGPDAARVAAGVANAISQDNGRHAAWAIQVDQGGEWATAAAERYDPKKQSLLGKLADIALPILGAFLLPGVGAVVGTLGATGSAMAGAALGSTASSVAQGRDLKETALRAALSGAGAGIADKFIAPAVNGMFNGAGAAAGTAAGGTAGGLAQAAGGIIPGSEILTQAFAPVTGIAAQGAAGLIPASAISAGLAQATAGMVTTPAVQYATSAAVDAVTGALRGAANAGVTVDELVVTAATNKLTQMAINGATQAALATAADGLLSPQGTTVDELTVTPNKGPGEITPIEPVTALGAVTGVLAPQPNGPLTTAPDPNLDQNKILQWIKDNPLAAAKLGLTAASLLGAAGGSGGKGGISGLGANITGAGTRASLQNPTFSASLPPPTFGAKTPRDMNMTTDQWQHYGQGAERSFFDSVPVRPSGVSDQVAQGAAPAQLAASPTTAAAFFAARPELVAQLAALNIPDVNSDGAVNDEDRMLYAKAQGLKRGGQPKRDFAVRGVGHGREDKIAANLSDGEYVIDAETVALLGNGSSKAGADALDKFRVKVRKHKGAQLAKGGFSADAKAPEAYLSGARA